jgi:hypothetical protein
LTDQLGSESAFSFVGMRKLGKMNFGTGRHGSIMSRFIAQSILDQWGPHPHLLQHPIRRRLRFRGGGEEGCGV